MDSNISSVDTEKENLQKVGQLMEAWWSSDWGGGLDTFETWHLILDKRKYRLSLPRCISVYNMLLRWPCIRLASHLVWSSHSFPQRHRSAPMVTTRLGLSYLRGLQNPDTLNCSIQKISVAQQVWLTPKWNPSSVCSLKISPVAGVDNSMGVH